MPTRFRAPAALALFLAGCASTSDPSPVPHPDIDVRERTVRYAVVGTTVEELSASLNAGAPSIEGRRYRAVTDWNVTWESRHAPRGSACEITYVDVELRLITTVPRWEPPPEADPDLVRQWAAYRVALDAHEAGHRDIAVAAANAVRRAVRGLRASSCDALSTLAEARGREVLRRYREENHRYDRETGHGRTQGAGWPPLASEVDD